MFCRNNIFVRIKVVSEPGCGAKEPPPGTPDQAELRIKSFVRIKVVLEPGLGAKEPPPGPRPPLYEWVAIPIGRAQQFCVTCRHENR